MPHHARVEHVADRGGNRQLNHAIHMLVFVSMYEVAAANVSFGRGLAQRAA